MSPLTRQATPHDATAHRYAGGDGAGGTHWSLLVYTSIDRRVRHYDSSNNSNEGPARALADRLGAMLALSPGDDPRTASLTFESVECAQQENGSDCGIYTIMHCEAAALALSTGQDLAGCGLGAIDAASALDCRIRLRGMADAAAQESAQGR